MQPGNIIFIYTVDGEQLIATYLREHRGFLLFEENGNVVALRPSSILTVTDTGTTEKKLTPLKLKKGEEDLPTEIITVDSPPQTMGRVHL